MIQNILRAIDVENTYIKNKINGEKKFELLDEIKRSGFESLEEYYKEKKSYLFKQLNFAVVNRKPSECIEQGWRLLNEKVAAIFFVDTPDVTVYSYNSKPYNKEYCQKNNITVYELPAGGGTIVSNKGDLAFGLCVPDNLEIDNYFILDNISDILRKYMDNVEIIDNDILVDGGKVCGITYLRHNDMILFLAHFSFSDNSKLIDSICHKDTKPIKTPSYIREIDKNTLKTEVVKWLQSI